MYNRKGLERLAIAIAQREADQLIGTQFDPSRIPTLDARTFTARAFELAVSPDSSYPFIERAIQSARRELCLYIYNISAPYLLDLLADRVANGVAVRIMYDTHDAGSVERAALGRLHAAIREAPSSGRRSVFSPCHQKFMVIDGKSVVVESANWATSSIPKPAQPGRFKQGNREWFIKINDQDVAKWFRDFFEADWNIPELPAVAEILPVVLPTELPGEMLSVMAVPAKQFPIKVVTSSAKVRPILSPTNYLADVLALLNSATESIYIQQQYIKAGLGVNDLLEVVARKAPTCDVRIIGTTKFPEAWEDTKATLRAAGLIGQLRALNLSYFVHCHNKGIVVDRRKTVVSSTNWSGNSITKAREAGVIVTSEEIADYYADAFEFDWDEGMSVSDADAQTLSIHLADRH
jgi:phosphatidylserine/phosphatidylglycerophosphate/cardiolipin synthase-like enzyme